MSDKKTFLTGAELSRLCSVSQAAITQAVKAGRLHRDPDTRKFDTRHGVNSLYVETKLIESQDGPADPITNVSPEHIPASMEELYREKLAAELRRTRAQAARYELDLAKAKGALLPADAVGIIMGHFAAGIKTFLFPIGRRVARGDKDLQRRIEEEISEGLKRTKENAAAALRREVAPVIAAMKEAEARAAGGPE